MKAKIVTKQIEEIESIATSHGIGEKKIFITHEQCNSQLMQAAMGTMKSGVEIESHKHKTMEEFYYFESGKVNFTIGETVLNCISGTFVKVPTDTYHSMKIIENTRFIYWGIAI
ncbi:MAG: cupin domain-containing protein [Bacteroidales bacterium]